MGLINLELEILDETKVLEIDTTLNYEYYKNLRPGVFLDRLDGLQWYV